MITKLIVPHLAKLDKISKQCAYQGSQVSSLGRLSLTYINVSHQDK